MTTLRKSDIAEQVADRLQGPRTLGDEALNAVIEIITENIANGNRVVSPDSARSRYGM